MSIGERIAEVGDRLTPTERRVAEAVLADPTLLAFGTVSDLAARVGTSRPTIVRFATKLGFGGYSDLQGWVRDGVAERLTTPSDRIRRARPESDRVRPELERAIQRTLRTLDHARVAAMAAPLVAARGIWVLSGETSMAGASVLHSGLAMVRSGVHLVEEHHLARDLSTVDPGDVAVVFDFARYRRTTVTAARALAAAGVQVLAITDGPLSPLSAVATIWCELQVPAVGPFDSSLPAVAAAELLVVEVVRQLGPAAAERIDRLEQFWRETDTFIGEGR